MRLSLLFVLLLIVNPEYFSIYRDGKVGVAEIGITVVDSMKARVPGAQIRLKCGEREVIVTTDEIGSAALTIPYGEYDVEVNKVGFQILKTRIVVRKRSQSRFEFEIKPLSMNHPEKPDTSHE